MNAVAELRRLTAWRAWRRLIVWIERAFGWGMLTWLLFWLVVYLIAGFQFITPLKTALPFEWLQLSSLLVTNLFVASFALSAMPLPSVILSNRDALRLGLGPAAPLKILEYPMFLALLQNFLVGALLGGVVWIAVRTVFLRELPFTPMALGLLLAARVYWSMNLYAGAARVWLLLIWLGSVLLDVFFGLGLSDVLTGASGIVLVIPVALILTGWLVMQQTYAASFPPQFLQHSLVLAQLRALGLMILQRATPAAGLRERLQRQLRVRVAKKRWRIPAPPMRYGATGALVWRSSLILSQWTPMQWVRLILGLMAFYFTTSSFIPNGFGLPAQVLILSFLAQPLIGSSLPSPSIPIRGSSLLLGRVALGGALVLISSFVAAIWLPTAFLLALRAITCLVLLEILQRWAKNPSVTANLGIAAALITFAPEALLGFVGLLSLESTVLTLIIGFIYAVQSVQD